MIVSLENASTFDCKLGFPISGQSIDQNCVLSWENIPSGTHNVPIIVSSGIAEYSHIVTLVALENFSDDSDNTDNETNVDEGDGIIDNEDNQNTGSTGDQDTGTDTVDSSSSSDGLSVISIISIIGVLILIISGAVFVILRKKSNDDPLPQKHYEQLIKTNQYGLQNTTNNQLTNNSPAMQQTVTNPKQQNPKPVLQIIPPPMASTPPLDMVGQQDQHGYEWVQFNGSNWYRQSGTNGAWIKWES